MSFTARMGALWPLPCRLAPLPGVPGAPPRGGVHPMCEGQTLASPLGFRIEIYDDFDVDLSFGG